MMYFYDLTGAKLTATYYNPDNKHSLKVYQRAEAYEYALLCYKGTRLSGMYFINGLEQIRRICYKYLTKGYKLVRKGA